MVHRDQTRVTFRAGFICACYSKRPVPETSDEMYAIMQELGLDVVKGLPYEEVDKRLTEFLQKKKYDAAMRVV